MSSTKKKSERGGRKRSTTGERAVSRTSERPSTPTSTEAQKIPSRPDVAKTDTTKTGASNTDVVKTETSKADTATTEARLIDAARGASSRGRSSRPPPKPSSATVPGTHEAVRAARSSAPPPSDDDDDEYQTVATADAPPFREVLSAMGQEGSTRSVVDLEESLGALVREAAEPTADEGMKRRAAEALRDIAMRIDGGKPQESRLGDARALLGSEYYLRQDGRAALRDRTEEIDELGFDPQFASRTRPLVEALYRGYFRVEVSGVEHLPAHGPAIVVANRSGTVPWDGLLLATAARLEHPAGRDLRWLVEDAVFHAPFLGVFLNRLGAVRACQENAERLLQAGKPIAVFPEGTQGLSKLYRDRYRLQRFGRGGYIKLAFRTGATVIPTAIVGGEDTNPLIAKIPFSSSLGFLPVTWTFPWFGPLGLMPLPAKWRIQFGAPIDLSEHSADSVEDAVLVNKLNDRVRTTIQSMLDDTTRTRESMFR